MEQQYDELTDEQMELEDVQMAMDSQNAAAEQEEWRRMADNAYRTSTDYMNTSWRKQWDRNYSNFQSKHPSGSKYHTEAYKNRSRLFRPKAKSMVRKNESALVNSLFSTLNAVVIDAADQNNPEKSASARIWGEVLNYRLTHEIPWFKIAIGAFQTAQVVGSCVGKVQWRYEVGNDTVDEAGERMQIEFIKENKPEVVLIEPENFRFDPAADWTDPIGSSPYLIHVMPMRVIDVVNRWGGDPRDIRAWGRQDEPGNEGTRDAREGGRHQDKYDLNTDIDEFDIVFVHENIMMVDGVDVVFYTLATNRVIGEVQRLEAVYPQGRPFVIGVSSIEAFNPVPASPVEWIQDLQAAANDLQNQRFDNVRQVLNARAVVDRNSNTDLQALRSNIPGSIILTDNTEIGVRYDRPPDVTNSSYSEQDRLNLDLDDLAGNFSTSSIASNRQLNETVGGMQMLSGQSTQATEYIIRVFVETWVEPVLRMLLKIEQMFEQPEYIQKVVGEFDPQLLQEEIDLVVNVGFSATNPQERVNRLMTALNTIAQSVPQLIQQLNAEEIASEVFGAVGYRDGKRFLIQQEEGQPNPQDQMMAQQQQMMEQQAQAEQQKMQMEAEVKAMELQIKQQELQLKAQDLQMRAELEAMKLQIQREQDMGELQLKREMESARLQLEYKKSEAEIGHMLAVDEYKRELEMQREKTKALDVMLKARKIERDHAEMALKERVGSGI